MKRFLKYLWRAWWVRLLVGIWLLGLLLPQRIQIPVAGATPNDWDPESYWYYPWGSSVTHKGIDIFAAEGTPILAATSGLVLFKGELSKGGNVVVVLGPKWRLHYYGHLQAKSVVGRWVDRGDTLGAVGTTGNAKGKPPHLHYSLSTLVPYPWQIRRGPHGHLRMFFLDPNLYFRPQP